MTVRTWFTISALVLVALAAAFAFRLFTSIPPPEIIVRVGEARVQGSLRAYCWPQRSGVKCDQQEPESRRAATIPSSGRMRFVVYPVPPEKGRVTIRDAETGETVLTKLWTERFSYELEPGRYTIDARGEYPPEAYVRYLFSVITTRSGS